MVQFISPQNSACFSISNYANLNCSSLPLHSHHHQHHQHFNANFKPITHQSIAPYLICPYSHTCSPQSCNCCSTSTTTTTTCNCSYICPFQCKCARDFSNTFHTVNCSSSNLLTIPSNLPATSTHLYLNNNNIKRIGAYQFTNSLVHIDLSNNNIAVIDEHAFDKLTRLRTLTLANNQLAFLLGYEFRELRSVETLQLDHNNIQYISSNGTFSAMLNLTYLDLTHNPLKHSIERAIFFKRNTRLRNLMVDDDDDDEANLLNKNKRNNSAMGPLLILGPILYAIILFVLISIMAAVCMKNIVRAYERFASYRALFSVVDGGEANVRRSSYFDGNIRDLEISTNRQTLLATNPRDLKRSKSCPNP